ncbi:MAG: hypothetical protein HYZ53_21190 [Planctomycetes bacterium]|nr:hypothetical protein [Planctomycetota bacterium]
MTRIFRTSTADGEPQVGVRPVEGGGAETKARRLEDEARAEAAGILEAARRKAESMRAEGQRRGIAEGFEAGYAVGLKHGREQALSDARSKLQADLEAMGTTLAGLLKSIEAERRALQTRVHRDLVDLALRIAEKVVQAHVAIDRETVLRTCARALELSSHKSASEVLVHPRDLELVEQHLPSLAGALGSLSAVTLRPDESIEPGGCRILFREGRIDADLHSQLDVLRRALLADYASAPVRGLSVSADEGPGPAPEGDAPNVD